MREIFTSGSVGGLVEQSPSLPGQPTALVHEAYLRLVDTDRVQRWDSRAHFFAAASEAMRRILVDNARRKASRKRGGGLVREPLREDAIAGTSTDGSLLALDEALSRLQQDKPTIGQLVQLRYFGGLTIEQAAEALRISPRTAKRYWVYAKAWLRREMKTGDGDDR